MDAVRFLHRPGAGALAAVAAFLGVGAMLLGVKLWLVVTYGNATPFWDQWDAEAAFLFGPYLQGSLHWLDLLKPHNEHRILYTRLLALLLLEMNGLWNPLLEMVVNAALHLLALGTLVVLAWKAAGRGTLPFLLGLAACVFLLPYGWENTLAGFQSQFYFVLFFSFVALWYLSVAPVFSGRWWAGVALAGMAYFSLASGAFALAAAAAATMVRACVTTKWKRELGSVAVLLVLFAAGVKAIPVLEYHASLRATSLPQLLEACLRALAWPLPNPWMALLRNAPLVVLAWIVVRRRLPAGDPRWFLLALAAWGCGQAVSLGYGRADDVLASRYLDLHAITLFINGAALAGIVGTTSGRVRRIWLAALIAWMLMCVAGLAQTVTGGTLARQLSDKRLASERQEKNLQQYLRTEDAAWMRGLPLSSLPYPAAERLAAILAIPAVRAILPWHLQPSLTPGEPPVGGGFSAPGVYPATPDCGCGPLGSYGPGGDADTGEVRLNYRNAGPSSIGRMTVMVAGYPSRGGELEIRQGDRAKRVSFTEDPGEAWARITFRVQPGPFEIRIADRSPKGWIAVGAPRPAGRLDGYVERVARAWMHWILLGAGLVALSLLLWRPVAGVAREGSPYEQGPI